MDRKTAYENMQMLADALGLTERAVLVSYWRHRVYGTATHEHRELAMSMLPAHLLDMFHTTQPGPEVLQRWSRDHGYQRV